ncbi:MAG: hypothetical protein WC827_03875 [Candidatus Paceibacterota bacterium]|jgi:hypothetical protein
MKIYSGKYLKITDDWSIYVLENENGTYISNEGIIKYKNIGKDFDIRITFEDFITIEQGVVKVLNAVGNPKFHFPLAWISK